MFNNKTVEFGQCRTINGRIYEVISKIPYSVDKLWVCKDVLTQLRFPFPEAELKKAFRPFQNWG